MVSCLHYSQVLFIKKLTLPKAKRQGHNSVSHCVIRSFREKRLKAESSKKDKSLGYWVGMTGNRERYRLNINRIPPFAPVVQNI